MRRGDDVDCAIRAERLDHAVEQRRFSQRLVALDINNVLKLRRMLNDLGNAIGPALMLWRSHRDLGAPIKRCFGYPHVVRGDNDVVQFLRVAATFPNVLKKRFVSNEMQWFSRKTRGTPACWNDADCLTHLRLSI